MQQPASKTWNGEAQISNGGAGHHFPPAGDEPACKNQRVAMMLSYLRVFPHYDILPEESSMLLPDDSGVVSVIDATERIEFVSFSDFSLCEQDFHQQHERF